MRYFLKITKGLFMVMFMGLVHHLLHAQQITRLEYYINEDPGFGEGTTINITSAADISNVSVQVPLQQIPIGISTIGIRAYDGNAWGITRLSYFLKSRFGLSPISRLEYFLNTDPGFGNATQLAITPGMNLENLVRQINIETVPVGLSRFGLRSFDGNTWSVTRLSFLLKMVADATNITRVEYFINEDPGFGQATPVAITPGENLAMIDFDADIQSLPIGMNFIGIRSFDGNKWSVTRQVFFLKNRMSAANINYLEYFLDDEPGLGNGTSVDFSPSPDVADITFDVNIATLQQGDHVFFIRSRGDDGQWSLTNIVPFNNGTLPVSFLNFAALLKNKTVQLEWETATETNNKHFVIERAVGNMGSFDSIGKVPGAGNSVLARQYRFSDYEVRGGTLYKYRIRQVDYDGKFSFSATRLVNASDLQTPIKITPTIVRHAVWVNHAKRGAILGVYDASGKQVNQFILQGDRDQINLTGLTKGIYFLVVHQGGKVLHHQKVLLE